MVEMSASVENDGDVWDEICLTMRLDSKLCNTF